MPRKCARSNQVKAQRASGKCRFSSAFTDNPFEKLLDPDYEPSEGSDNEDPDPEGEDGYSYFKYSEPSFLNLYPHVEMLVLLKEGTSIREYFLIRTCIYKEIKGPILLLDVSLFSNLEFRQTAEMSQKLSSIRHYSERFEKKTGKIGGSVRVTNLGPSEVGFERPTLYLHRDRLLVRGRRLLHVPHPCPFRGALPRSLPKHPRA